LLVDGVTNGAVYALVALSLIIVYTVTRVVNIAQGEYVMLGALSFASTLGGALSPLCLPVVGLLAAFLAVDLLNRNLDRAQKLRLLLTNVVWIAGLVALTWLAYRFSHSYWLAAVTSVAVTASLGPLVHRLSVEPAPDASQVVLLIVSVGVYMVLHGCAAMLWGAEPRSVPPIAAGGLTVGPVFVTYQSLCICLLSLVAMVALYLFSERTLTGQALQAVAINRVGAQLCGIPVRWAGQLSFAVAAGFSAFSGLLLAPLVTANYEMGFLVGLKGFVGATLGGIIEYPTALIGVALVGTIESFAAFYASALRDLIVFLLVIPILLWRNAVKPPQGHGH
jgi:branched-chain amino acid transport system permease protein